MRPVDQVLGEYAAYHRHPLNRMTHYFGIPLIVFSLLLILSVLSFDIDSFEISAASILIAVVVIWYFILDIPLGMLSAAILLSMLQLAELTAAATGSKNVTAIVAITFIAGWILQLIGHHIEKRRPALVDNFLQVFSAPLFLVSELVFSLGLRQSLAMQVEEISHRKVSQLNGNLNEPGT